jgi:hypothetical protein
MKVNTKKSAFQSTFGKGAFDSDQDSNDSDYDANIKPKNMP